MRELNLANLQQLDFGHACSLITPLNALEKVSFYQNPIDPDACVELASLYALGLGVPQNDQVAVAWLHKATGEGILLPVKYHSIPDPSMKQTTLTSLFYVTEKHTGSSPLD